MKSMLFTGLKIIAVFFPLIFIFCMEIRAQDDSQKERARISLDFYNSNNSSQKLVASVRTRLEGFFQPVPGANIKFYRDSISEEMLIGNVATDHDGEAQFIFSWLEDTALVYRYIASLESHPNFSDAAREIEIWKSLIEMQTIEEDSVRTVLVFIGRPANGGAPLPVGDVNVRIYVRRLFGLLPVSEEFGSTDDEGYFYFEFPADIPGNENGNLSIIAQVNDHEEFGNIEFSKEVSWGIPVAYNQSLEAKELWLSSSNVPKVLVFTVSLLVIGVVVTIVYIVFMLIKIRNLGFER